MTLRLLSFIVVTAALQSPVDLPIFTSAEAQLLVENTPEVRRARTGYRAPQLTPNGEDSAFFAFQARSKRTRGAASGLIDNYVVEKRTGRVFRGSTTGMEVDSFLIRELRAHLLNRSQAAIPRAVVELRGDSLLRDLSKRPLTYSIFGVVLGQPFPAVTPGLRSGPLTLDLPSGTTLSGYGFSALKDPDNAPGVTAYLGANDRIVEFHIEVLPSDWFGSLDAYFGKEFVTSIATDNAGTWKKTLGIEPFIARGEGAVFIDSPSNGMCACLFGSASTWTPIFLSFYTPGVSPKGEKLPDTILRRKTYCLGSQEE